MAAVVQRRFHIYWEKTLSEHDKLYIKPSPGTSLWLVLIKATSHQRNRPFKNLFFTETGQPCLKKRAVADIS